MVFQTSWHSSGADSKVKLRQRTGLATEAKRLCPGPATSEALRGWRLWDCPSNSPPKVHFEKKKEMLSLLNM